MRHIRAALALLSILQGPRVSLHRKPKKVVDVDNLWAKCSLYVLKTSRDRREGNTQTQNMCRLFVPIRQFSDTSLLHWAKCSLYSQHSSVAVASAWTPQVSSQVDTTIEEFLASMIGRRRGSLVMKAMSSRRAAICLMTPGHTEK